jgi:YfiH family protein
VGDDPAAVRANRDLVCRALGVDALTIADQCHGAAVAAVDEGLAGAGHTGDHDAQARLPATDGLVTALPGVALAVLVADCQPVVCWDPVARAVGVAHAGRRGTLLGVVPAVVEAMVTAFGTRPADLRVGLGPHIAGPSYEVGPAEVAEVERAFPDLGLLEPTRQGHANLDLAPAVLHQLAEAGVAGEAVEVMALDTRTSTDLLFSHRAARPTGRFALVAVIDR